MKLTAAAILILITTLLPIRGWSQGTTWNVLIPGLDPIPTAPSTSDSMPVVHSGVTYKISPLDLGSITTTDGSHTVTHTTGITFGTGLLVGGSAGAATVNLTSSSRSASSAAIASTDGAATVLNTSGGMTIANATGGLGDGFGANVLAVAAATITPTTATINGNATEPLGIKQGASIFSLSGEYYAILGMPEPVASSVLVASSGRVPAWQAGTSSQYVRGDGSANQSAAFTSGTLAGLTGLAVRDTSAAFDLTFAGTSSGALTAGHTLIFNVVNADRTFKLGSNLTVVTDPGGITGALKSNGSGTFAAAASGDLSDTSNIDLLNAAQTYTAAKTFAEVHGGLPETVTLTSNDYVAVAADCGKIKVLPTGTTPTVHLPNLNVGCTITFVTSVAISYQFLPASGGTVWSSTAFNKTRGTAAGDTVSATITVNSASAAKWVISGDVTS